MMVKTKVSNYPAYAVTGDDSKKKDQTNQYPCLCCKKR